MAGASVAAIRLSAWRFAFLHTSFSWTAERRSETPARWATHMDESSQQRWHRAVMILGVVYLVVGITFAALAGWVSSNQMRVTWRLLAWVISAAADEDQAR